MVALDVEESAPILRNRRLQRNDNGTTSNNIPTIPTPPPGLPARHPLQILKRSAIIGATLYALYGESLLLLLFWKQMVSNTRYHLTHIMYYGYCNTHTHIL